MAEKLIVFLFAGILGVLCYHYAAAAIFHHFFAFSPTALAYWYVPLAVVPALLLLGLAWCLGFGRAGSGLWGNLAVLCFITGIVFFTIGAPYNCWKEFCF